MIVEPVYAIVDVDGHLKGLAATRENAVRWLRDLGFKPADAMGFPGRWYKGTDYYMLRNEVLWR